jgi:hypothetical protein
MSMSSAEGNSEDRPSARRWTFSIWDMMQFLLAVAIALATGKNMVAAVANTYRLYQELGGTVGWFGSWAEFGSNVVVAIAMTLLAPVSGFIALSLVRQALRLLHEGRQIQFPSLDERCGWHFEWAGRLVLATLILGCLLIDSVFTPAQFGLHVPDEMFWPESVKTLRMAIVVVCVLAALGWNTRSMEAKPQRAMRSRWLDLAALPFAVLLALLVWEEASIIPQLVLVAVLGIEAAQPLKFADPSIPVVASQRIAIFYDYASLATVAAVGCSSLCGLQFQVSSARWRLRLVIFAALVAGWSVQSWFLVWVARRGYYLLSPSWTGPILLSQRHVLVTALVLCALVGAIVSYRGSRIARPVSESAGRQTSRRTYFHEGRLVLSLLTVAAIALNLPLALMGYLAAEGCLWLALLVFCAGRWWIIWRGRGRADGEVVWILPPGRFLANWFATSVTILTAAPTLALFNFVYWLGPPIWWRIFELYN